MKIIRIRRRHLIIDCEETMELCISNLILKSMEITTREMKT